MLSLKLCWRKPVIKSVTALQIVDHFDIVEDVLPGVVPSCIGLALDALPLQQLEEAFSDSIVMMVSTPALPWLKPIRRQEISPVLAGELQTLIRRTIIESTGWRARRSQPARVRMQVSPSPRPGLAPARQLPLQVIRCHHR